ncbi:MAG: hypothetical protein J4F34_04805 [Gemmatimonadetes bacterium]|nr:hypothetical protein [Gemmatimonadota bacterium]
MARWGLLALGVGLALGFGLGSLGLLPVADVDIRWTVPALSVDEGYRSGSGAPRRTPPR